MLDSIGSRLINITPLTTPTNHNSSNTRARPLHSVYAPVDSIEPSSQTALTVPSAPAFLFITEAQQAAVGFLKSQEQREGEPIRVHPQNSRALPDNYGAIAALPLAAGDSPIMLQRAQDIFSSGEEWRLWQLLNVKYFVSFGHSDEAIEEVFTAPPLKVYRVRYSLPRAWLVEDVRLAESAQQAREMVSSPAFNPGRTAVVEMPPQHQPSLAADGEPGLRQNVRFDYYSPRRLYLHVTTNRDALLVLSEIYYPGWEARVDGTPTRIHRANSALRGIELPPGEHQVEMVYNPPIFWIGLAISALSMAAIAATWLWSWRQSRSPGQSAR